MMSEAVEHQMAESEWSTGVVISTHAVHVCEHGKFYNFYITIEPDSVVQWFECPL